MSFAFWDPNGDEPVYASRLNAGALWRENTLTTLKTTDTTDLPTGAEVVVDDMEDGTNTRALLKFNKTSTETADDFYVVEPTTGGGRYELQFVGVEYTQSLIIAGIW